MAGEGMSVNPLFAKSLAYAGDRCLWAREWRTGHAVLYLDWTWIGQPYRFVRMRNWPMNAHGFNLWPLHFFVARYTAKAQAARVGAGETP